MIGHYFVLISYQQLLAPSISAGQTGHANAVATCTSWATSAFGSDHVGLAGACQGELTDLIVTLLKAH
jgi:hypothetical protein